ncbi:hypothetical protein AB6A40_000722 [Gnathostoma spinigerum]|uniref:Uncharacterized protein n=1 Tax=Gnathostoma spinigerum TaxID=75299 RepID=A0ABD6E2Q9_9BILA
MVRIVVSLTVRLRSECILVSIEYASTYKPKELVHRRGVLKYFAVKMREEFMRKLLSTAIVNTSMQK